jgi:hypothetical protein
MRKVQPPITVTGDSCHSHGCNWNCVSVAMSRLPLYHLKFIEIIPEGMQVGIGVTSNPDLRKGIRFCNKNGGVYLNSKHFYFGKDETSPEELFTSLGSQIKEIPLKWEQESLGLAVDYEQGQLLLKWPICEGTMRFDLPENLPCRLLFPLVQAWNRCKLHLKKQTNQTTPADLGGIVLFDKEIFAKKAWSDSDDAFHYAVEIPTLFPGQEHTIKCSWRDQGWGNRKGQLAIVAHVTADGDLVKKVSRGRLVASSPTAGHFPPKLTLDVLPKIGEKYHLFYKVGSGGGHGLLVDDLRLKAVSNTSEVESITPMMCLASLQRSKDNELKELRKNLQEQSDKTNNAKVKLAEAHLKVQQLQANIEVERKDAILTVERSATALFRRRGNE